MKNNISDLSKKVVSYFLQGLLLMSPVFITIYAIFYIFNLLDSRANDLFEYVSGHRLPGLGIAVMFVFITLVGLLGSSLLVRPLFMLLEQLMERTPFVKIIYSSFKDFISAFLSNKKKFNQPVLVEVGKNSGIFRPGFITQSDLSELHLPNLVAVYIPHSYAFSGILYFANKDQVQPLQQMSGGDMMKFIISGGVAEIDEEKQVKPNGKQATH